MFKVWICWCFRKFHFKLVISQHIKNVIPSNGNWKILNFAWMLTQLLVAPDLWEIFNIQLQYIWLGIGYGLLDKAPVLCKLMYMKCFVARRIKAKQRCCEVGYEELLPSECCKYLNSNFTMKILFKMLSFWA